MARDVADHDERGEDFDDRVKTVGHKRQGAGHQAQGDGDEHLDDVPEHREPFEAGSLMQGGMPPVVLVVAHLSSLTCLSTQRCAATTRGHSRVTALSTTDAAAATAAAAAARRNMLLQLIMLMPQSFQEGPHCERNHDFVHLMTTIPISSASSWDTPSCPRFPCSIRDRAHGHVWGGSGGDGPQSSRPSRSALAAANSWSVRVPAAWS